MSVQVQDVVFKFEDSCNCCWKNPIRDQDPVYVSPRGQVTKFDFKKKPSADVNARKALQNIERRIQQLAASHEQTQAVLARIQQQLDISIAQPKIVTRAEVERIEEIAVAVFRELSPRLPQDSPEMHAPPPTPHRQPSMLVKSQKMRDLSLGTLEPHADYVDVSHSDAEVD